MPMLNGPFSIIEISRPEGRGWDFVCLLSSSMSGRLRRGREGTWRTVVLFCRKKLVSWNGNLVLRLALKCETVLLSLVRICGQSLRLFGLLQPEIGFALVFSYDTIGEGALKHWTWPKRSYFGLTCLIFIKGELSKQNRERGRLLSFCLLKRNCLKFK